MPDPHRIVVSNTTPIISLALIQKLDLLQQLYGEVWIPSAVESEIVAGGMRAGARELKSASYILTKSLRDSSRADLLSDLDRGEAEVIALALECNADLVIIDERLGRLHAQRLKIPLTGVLGVLLRAKQRGLLAELKPLIMQLRQAGIRLSDDVVARALMISGEI
jgi:uncharacterized protein